MLPKEGVQVQSLVRELDSIYHDSKFTCHNQTSHMLPRRLKFSPSSRESKAALGVEFKKQEQGLPGGPVVRNPPSNAGHAGLIMAGALRPHTPQAAKPEPRATEPTSSGACAPPLERPVRCH